ncbi:MULTISPECIES: glycoside hydrolase family 2 protein [Terrabacteria group]|uniref:glycoside hydrolase family 2 protein n=1 Tax=Bacillati TaxID=1783272 RepID=UPI001C6EB345|nr:MULTISPECIES: sugar-binding domain-containing protein [Terrabacteria group]MBW9212946.1 hypothetical protein [Trueperella sp. zg.1013]
MNIKPFQEYPRMSLQRDNYVILNGLWDLQICSKGQDPVEDGFQSILVPFVPGTPASLYPKKPRENEVLWYQLQFAYLPCEKQTFLHFEAVDQDCEIYLNGVHLGNHRGSYDAFEVDVSSVIKYQNILVVRVEDNELSAFGYQKDHPFSGIYGSVWLENRPIHCVDEVYVEYKDKRVFVHLKGDFEQAAIIITEKGKLIHSGITNQKVYEVEMKHPHLWSLEDPFLYDIYVQTEEDLVKSYFALRTIEKKKGKFCLNGEAMWINGIVDETWLEKSGPICASEKEMKERLSQIKALGFQAIRKYGTLERSRWFYLCDQMGILVFQDVPQSFQEVSSLFAWGKKERSESEKKEYRQETSILFKQYKTHPSLAAWILFPDGHGAFEPKNLKVNCLWDISEGQRLLSGDFCLNGHLDASRISIKTIGGLGYWQESHHDLGHAHKQYGDKIDWNQAIEDLLEAQVEASVQKGYAGYFYKRFQDCGRKNDGLFSKEASVIKVNPRIFEQWNRYFRRLYKHER